MSVCVCVWEKETFEGIEVRSVSDSLCILVCSLQMLIFDPCSTQKHINFCHHSADQTISALVHVPETQPNIAHVSTLMQSNVLSL